MAIELKDYIYETLKQVVDGIIAAQEYAKDKGTIIVPEGLYNVSADHTMGASILGGGETYVNIISFDVAVTASEGAQTKSGIGVFVSALGAGVQGQSDATSSTASRIKFTVPITLPRQKK